MLNESIKHKIVISICNVKHITATLNYQYKVLSNKSGVKFFLSKWSLSNCKAILSFSNPAFFPANKLERA